MFRAFVLAALILCMGPVLAADPAPVSPEQRAQIERIVKEYLLANPDVLREAFANLERADKEAEVRAQSAAVVKSKDELFSAAHDGALGNPNGTLTIVEFFDYNCGFCKRSMADADKLLKSDPNLKIVVKEFPVLGQGSIEAAQISAQLASEPRFAEFHNRLLGSREHADKALALKIAKDMGFDTRKLESGMSGAITRDQIDTNLALAQKLSVSGTPTYVIGDEIVVGAVGFATLNDKIKAMRQCGKTAC